jgi:hypothetical protein
VALRSKTAPANWYVPNAIFSIHAATSYTPKSLLTKQMKARANRMNADKNMVSGQLSAVSGQPYTGSMKISLNTDCLAEIAGQIPEEKS